jgi:hypothetical protein
MQNHPVIQRVPMVSVPPPAGGPDVYFDIPLLETPTGGDNGVTQIGAAVIVGPTGIDDFDRPVLFSDQVGPSRQAVLPNFNDTALRKIASHLFHPIHPIPFVSFPSRGRGRFGRGADAPLRRPPVKRELPEMLLRLIGAAPVLLISI